eukprot:scaffold12832_cov50-Attheya_sp.AAC.8
MGGAFFHMIPHAVEVMGNVTALYVWLLAGFTMFLALEMFLHWHHSHTHGHECGPLSPPHTHQHPTCPASPQSYNQDADIIDTNKVNAEPVNLEMINDNTDDGEIYGPTSTGGTSTSLTIKIVPFGDEAENSFAVDPTVTGTSNSCKRWTAENSTGAQQRQQNAHRESLGWLIIIADVVHNFLGGLFVGASFVDGVELGLTAWAAAAAHELPQELGDFAILLHGGWSKSHALLANFLSSLTFLLGGVIAYATSQTSDVSFLIPLAAGNFIYIGATDLIPEVKHHHGIKPNALHFGSFLAGVGILLAIRVVVDGW